MSGYRAKVELPPTMQAPATARGVVGALLRGWGLLDLSEDARIVVSELVTNAVKHVGGEASFELELVLHGDALRLSLADGSSVRPLARALGGDTEGGRGVRIIELLATRWGVEDHEGGKRVWAELRPRPGQSR